MVPISKASFSAFGTAQYGCHVAAGAVDTDPFDEIVASQGPGPALPSSVEGYDYDGVAIVLLTGLQFQAFPPATYGVTARVGDIDTTGNGDILAGRGPDPAASADVRGFLWNGSGVSNISWCSFPTFPTLYGVDVDVAALGF